MKERSTAQYRDVNALPPDIYAAYLAHLRARGVGSGGKVVNALVLAVHRVLRAKAPAARREAQWVFAEVLAADMREWVKRTTA